MNKCILFKKDNLTIFYKRKKTYLSVEIDKKSFNFHTYFFKNYYNPNNNFLLNYKGTDDDKLLFVFPDDFNFIDYSFKTKYNFLTNSCKFKRLLFKNVDLEYNLNNFIIKRIIELKKDNLIEKDTFLKICKKFNFSLERINEKFYSNVIGTLIFDKLLIHKRKDKFFFLDYNVFTISTGLQIEDSVKINYFEI